MPFTNVWDTTFPPDTQLANLLGLDLRNFRLDTQQRMAAISGLDASKPAFGGDAQPANWNGVLFFATDTGNIYQWTNPAWNQVFNFKTTKLINNTQPQFNATGTTTLITIPAGNMVVGSHVRIVVSANATNASETAVLNYIFGGNNVTPALTAKSDGFGNGGLVNVIIDIQILTLTTAMYSLVGIHTPSNTPTPAVANNGNGTLGLANVSSNATTFQINVSSLPFGAVQLGVCALEIF